MSLRRSATEILPWTLLRYNAIPTATPSYRNPSVYQLDGWETPSHPGTALSSNSSTLWSTKLQVDNPPFMASLPTPSADFELPVWHQEAQHNPPTA